MPVLGAPGSVRGRLLAPAGSTAEAMLVFLEPLDAAGPPAEPAPPAVVRASARGIAPALLAVAVGGSVRFENDANLYHRLFSYSEPNVFDLVLHVGNSKTVPFRKPGVVRVYCSLHPAEGAVVFVSPSRWFTTFRPSEPYEIRDVPPGRYRLGAFGEGMTAEARNVTIQPGVEASVEITGRRSAMAK
jgi:plastocyanin